MPALYAIELTKKAFKNLAALPRAIQLRLKTRIDRLAYNPRPADTKKLSGVENLYRLRVADYRILYEIRDAHLRILVVEVGHRRDIYRRL